MNIYLRTLRATYNKAIVADVLKDDTYPFKKFKIKSGNATKRALSKKDMQLLMNFKPEANSRKWHSLNYFIFNYLTRGMNLKDIALLKWNDNIVGGRILYERAKTKNTKKSQGHNIIKIECADQITHYWTRHTYAATLKRSGISTAVISEVLGHSSEATTKADLDKFEQSELDDTFKHLL